MKNGFKQRIISNFTDNLVSHAKQDNEEPLRSEVFSVEQMQIHSKFLAETHRLSMSNRHSDRLLARLVENEAALNDVSNALGEAILANRSIFPAADWLLDNFYLIEEHIYTSKRDLPKGYSRGLPRLASGQSAGLPRVYDIALERISHGDGLVDPDTIRGFLDAYQSVSVLTLGELWAIPIMLRLALIENLRRVAVRIAAEMRAQSEADSWADRMALSVESDPKNLILLIADMARSDPPIVSSFVAELARKLQGKGAALALPLTWIEQRLSEAGLTIDQLVQTAMRDQAADQVSISNSIRGLRSLGAIDWKILVENTSVVEKILRTDPSGCYGKMDFATRDRYRHVVEKTANRAGLPEEAVANHAIQMSIEGCDISGGDDRLSHVGYYLVDKGHMALLKTVRVRATAAEVSRASGFRGTLCLYLGSIGIVAAMVTVGLGFLARAGGIQALWMWLILLPAWTCAMGLAVAIVNWIVTLSTEPRFLPRMDFSEKIPAASRTLVIVPSMLSGIGHIDHLAEALEIRFLANRDENLLFGLLTDYQDSRSQTTPLDGDLLRYVQSRIEALNEQYGSERGKPFFLFHRPRSWNPGEQKWIGYERKRGKLAELNALLMGGNGSGFELVLGNLKRLKTVKYVITLDTDTQLPRDSARQLAGIMAHPLNHAVYDEKRSRVVEGYSILQPRVVASLPGTRQSLYSRLNNSEPGIDPYTRAVSDVYQDLFDEGSFIGKGIYDVEAFEKALEGRFPQDRILSHDLLEGCYARSGLVSDVQLYEESPVTYRTDTERRRRWIRGDWQIARWILPTVPAPGGGSRRNALSMLSKWKIFDNLRRSVQAPALTFLFMFGWIAMTDSLLWSLALAGIILLPPLLISGVGFVIKSREMPLASHLLGALKSSAVRVAQSVFTMACLPYEATIYLGLIVKTAWRTLITRRHLLEWKPSEEYDRCRFGAVVSFRSMWAAPALAMATYAAVLFLQAQALPVAVPLVGLWLVSPLIAWAISRPLDTMPASLSVEQYEYLGMLARKTWSFFETFVGQDDNWLPPDNFQEVPFAKIAHRTSPTNIGLAFLANLTAYDLGYLSAGNLLDRTELALKSMMQLERYRGHLYNWYDTMTLEPLIPRYVSTVDSGNLAAHLLTLGAGLGSLPEDRILGDRFWDGLRDCQFILIRLLGPDIPQPLKSFGLQLEAVKDDEPVSMPGAVLLLQRLAASATALSTSMGAEAGASSVWWAEALARQVLEALHEIEYLAPWVIPGFTIDVRLVGENAPDMPSLRTLYALEIQWLSTNASSGEPSPATQENSPAARLEALVREGMERAEARFALIDRLRQNLLEFERLDYSFLYSKRRHLFAIGYDVEGHRRDLGNYDLLASEARLASFMGIAQGEIPQENWFALGRLLVDAGGKSLLYSWSGSMFEYLMPLLVMPTFERTLLGQTCKTAVARQIEYGRQRGIPWGISESGYNSFDIGLNYQYRAFGVPGLGLKRGLEKDLVIAPYATALALMIMPNKACNNLQRLSAEGFEGDYGLYEAIDFTESRVPAGQSNAIVRSFMAHHQGMSLISFASQILDRPMQRRFESVPQVQATMLLLEEKIPRATRFASQAAEMPELRATTDHLRSSARVFSSPDSTTPAVHLLSNGSYHVMVTDAGSGYSRWNELAVTRWKEDATADGKGNFLYIQDVATREFWSNSYQPTCKRPEHYEAIFSEGRAEFRRRDHDLITYTEIAVSPENDIELRRVRIENRSRTKRTIEITSYAEVVLAKPSSDAVHPGFSNLFIQTEIIEDKHAILCNRRPRSHGDPVHWMLQLMIVRNAKVVEVSYETDRLVFIGRGNTLAAPHALKQPGPLSGSRGSVLDPIVAIRQRILIEPDSTATIDLVTGVADARDSAMGLVDKYQDKRFANRAFELARTHSQVILQQINGSEADAQLYGELAGHILYAHASLRADPGIITANRRGQSGLWGYSISGDLPIVLLLVKDPANIGLVRQMVQAHAYLRQKGLAVDLIIWNEERGGYRQQLHDQILGLITASAHASAIDRSGGIFVRSADQISAEDRTLIQAVARVVINDNRGSLEEQIGGRLLPKALIPRLALIRGSRNHAAVRPVPIQDLQFWNGHGGFSKDGCEYIITLPRDRATPAPWANVLANPSFGTVISENGMAYTWSENAHEFRLTPWHDDPVCDTSGEALYIRDEESGHFWSPSPLPCKGNTPYIARHGFGYSIFEHSEQGIRTELRVYVALDASVKFSTLKFSNESGRTRKLSATAYAELVLGELPSKSAMHIVTEIDATTGAIFARNGYNTEFSGRVVFMDASGNSRTVTGDRTEFIGRNGTLGNPEAMRREHLSGRTGAAMDPCAAIQVPFELANGQDYEISFKLGSGRDEDEAIRTVRQFRTSGAAKQALVAVRAFWKHTLEAVQVETPDASLNVLANGWLMYQVLSSRIWGRSGYHQSGGAFGYRDQLQDAMALVHAEPDILRAQVVLCASRQFPEGDVQHWWHPPAGRGSRTHCSDDYLWLPMATCRYVECTGDKNILDQVIPFIEGRLVGPDEESYYDLPDRSTLAGNLYDHCVRAIMHGASRGSHGLPLMGSGDWNDGMNKVGEGGLGESVWLAFFQYEVLTRFSGIALLRDDRAFSEYCLKEAAVLRTAIETQGWDGAWYRRAYFDDGTPLGSTSNVECRIDSIPQSWSVLSGAADPERSRVAMESMYSQLVRRDTGLIRLLEPAFDTALPNPGYIKGYVPGVRENGGQYTHAAIWSIMAFAKMGNSERVWELFSMVNPIHHTSTPETAAVYMAEPYVMSADVYSIAPHTGRAGWTWYTGSAGLMYRLIIESLLGISLLADTLHFKPCIPKNWQGFKIRYRYRQTVYRIEFSLAQPEASGMMVLLDGILKEGNSAGLVDDRGEHRIDVRLPGEPAPAEKGEQP